MSEPIELPIAGGPPHERADAARNRRRILQAAERLFARQGVECTSMEAIAAEAGVGKGTLFRRFESRAALAAALLSEQTRTLQEAAMHGPPPLGPGAPPAERIAAYGAAELELIELHADLLLAASGTVRELRWETPPVQAQRAHLLVLLREALPGTDVGYLADALLAPLEPGLVVHQRRARGVPLEDLQAGYADLARRVCA